MRSGRLERRKQLVRAIEQGPARIFVDLPSDELFYGWAVLTLASRPSSGGHVEVRSAYANVGNVNQPDQPIAILRVVQVDAVALSAAHSSDSDEVIAEVVVPGKHVWIPLAELTQWIRALEAIDVRIGESSSERSMQTLRMIRLDLNWQSGVFEKRWSAIDEHHEALNEAWMNVWQRMEMLMLTNPDPVDVTVMLESWQAMLDTTGIVYDSTLYHAVE